MASKNSHPGHRDSKTRLKGALAGLEVANKRQHEDLSIERAREKQAEDQVATLRGRQHEQDRVITGLREALAAREAALADAEARATQAQARAEDLVYCNNNNNKDWLWYSPFYVETSQRIADDCRTERDVGGVDSCQDDPPEDRTAVPYLSACRGGKIQ